MSDTKNERKNTRRLSTIVPYLRDSHRYLWLGGLFIILTNVLSLTTPFVLKSVTDLLDKGAVSSPVLNSYLSWFSPDGTMSTVLYLLLLMLGLSLAAGLFRFLVRRTIIWMSRNVEYHLRDDLVSHLLILPQSFYHQNRTGDIMARATNDLEAVRMMIGPGIMHTANTVVGLVVALGFMLTMSPKLTAYALIPMLIFPYAVNRLGNLIHRKFTRIQEKFSDMNVAAQENLSGMRVVKAYRQEEQEVENFAKISEDYVSLNMGMAKLQGVFFPLIHFLASGVNLVVLYLGGRAVIGGEISLGTMVAFYAYLHMLFWPLFAMGWVVSLYQRGTASLDRINRILFRESEVKNSGPDLIDKPMGGDIEFRDLNFSYNGARVLEGISLSVKAGQTIGIMGMTGSGKTTLVSLLARLYPVPRGAIHIDGIDINDWDLTGLRRQIGFATQEPFLFSDTVEENIRFGDEPADSARIEAASRDAALAADVDTFPRGYKTIVGERGITLSGGQKQRTAIARALLVEPSILILDDATSSVDTETEHKIHERVHRANADRTTFIISHRVSSVSAADKIVYLDGGRIVEEGTHDELVAKDGHYASLYKAQLLEMEIESL